jgi:hypothetical protein
MSKAAAGKKSTEEATIPPVGGSAAVACGIVAVVEEVPLPAGVVVPPPPPTVTLPFMEGCISQWYAIVPGLWKVCEKDCPGCNVSESNDPASAVTVCGAESSFIHVTVVPGATVRLGGLNAKFLMLTVCWLPCAPAPGTIISRARKETVIRHNKRFMVFSRFSCSRS